jgi:hypothetical protein
MAPAPRRRDKAGWGRQTPGAPPASVLGAGDQLYGDCLDPARGLVAVDAARIVSRSLLVVIEKVGSLLWAVQPMQAKRGCIVAAPDSDDIRSSSTESESKMDSSWKLVE